MKLGRPRSWGITEEVHAELRSASKEAVSAKDKDRLQAGLLAAQGILTLDQIAQAVGKARSSIQTWLGKLKAGGVAGLLERGSAPGAEPALSPSQQEELKEQIARGKHRTADQIGAWIAQRWGVKLERTAVYYWLGKLAAVLRVARPQHRKHDAQKAGEFRLDLLKHLHALNLPKDRPVKVWVQDEGRHGLHGFTRRVWTLKGVKPIVPMQQSYQWFYTFAALECTEGKIELAHWSSVDLEIMDNFLRQIAASDPGAEHVVIYDGAGFHPRAQVHKLPEHVHVITLPPYSPELNPVEGLWDAVRDETCNCVFDTLSAMEQQLTQAFTPYWKDAQRVISLIHGWIKRTVNGSSQSIPPVFN
jgi:transposase